jgi:phosphopantetheine adenylyltransferase
MNQYRYLQDLMPEIQMVCIFCDKLYDYISSSGIRTLSKYGSDKVKDYLI